MYKTLTATANSFFTNRVDCCSVKKEKQNTAHIKIVDQIIQQSCITLFLQQEKLAGSTVPEKTHAL